MKIRQFLCWLSWLLLRCPSVILIDFDGQMNIRLAKRVKDHFWATRMGLGVSQVTLLPSGKTRGCDYVDGWEPLYPPTLTIG